jgi:hypothetical protein
MVPVVLRMNARRSIADSPPSEYRISVIVRPKAGELTAAGEGPAFAA